MNKLMAYMSKTNNIRIRNKLILSYILVVFIPVMIVGVFLTVSYRQDVLNTATQQTLNNVDKIKKQTAEVLRMPIEISNNLLADKRLRRLVNTDFESTYDVVEAYWDFGDFKDYIQKYREVYNIRFYTQNKTILNNWEFLYPDENVTKQHWYQEVAEQNKIGIYWYYIPDETKGGRQFLTLVRNIYFPEYRSKGVVAVAVNPEELGMVLSQETFDTMIYDEQGYIVAAKNSEWVGQNIFQMDISKELSGKPPGTYEIRYEGKPSKMVIEELLPASSRNGLKIVSLFTIDSIVSGANRISLMGFTIIVISLVIAFILILFSSAFMSKRMLLLNKYLSKVALGDLHVTSSVDGNDEIGLLSKQFNHMVVSIRGLMDEVSESQRQQNQLQLRQREIKLKMMASQINPHFLFNALESIRMKAHIKGEAEIAGVVKLLGKLMRRNIEIGARQIALKEEVEIVRSYLEVQKFRYGNERLAFQIEVDPGVLHIMIPPLIIQPLVENAVVHGLENTEAGGVVRVTAELAGSFLRVAVEDNGSGITEERRLEIYRSLQDMEEEEEYRIGLRNVHQRLVLTYGEEYGLQMNSGWGEGTTVSFLIPIGGPWDE